MGIMARLNDFRDWEETTENCPNIPKSTPISPKTTSDDDSRITNNLSKITIFNPSIKWPDVKD